VNSIPIGIRISNPIVPPSALAAARFYQKIRFKPTSSTSTINASVAGF